MNIAQEAAAPWDCFIREREKIFMERTLPNVPFLKMGGTKRPAVRYQSGIMKACCEFVHKIVLLVLVLVMALNYVLYKMQGKILNYMCIFNDF